MNLDFISNDFNENDFREFIQNTFEDFEIKNGRFKQDDLTDVDKEHIAEYKYLGNAWFSDDKELGILILKTTNKNIENKRVGFSNIINKLSKPFKTETVLVAIYNENSDVWRLTFVSFDFKDGKQIQKTNSKRYTFELGNVQTRTAKERLKLLDDIDITQQKLEEVFSVEKLSDEFFREYKKLHYKLVDNIIVINKDKESLRAIKDEKAVSSYIKKMLGRIVFLYFVQKKEWLNEDKNFLTNLFDEHSIYNNKGLSEDINFYDSILEKLFINALNKSRPNNEIIFGNKTYKVPYLNGGLFDEDKLDRLDIAITNSDLQSVFSLFDRYNFTIIEDTPHDSEVAIDPEMLGRVFEDLLEDRKDKGAFYTPREIVHYMCHQSINNYLDTKPKEQSQLEYLKQIKILDPAIGSGAFPMGMLHEIVQKRIELGDSTKLGELKREVIQNSIYGIDIEPSAVEIAKLRFWLSIVVDEDKPIPLPNLFYKIMVGNSLIETIDNIDPLSKRKKGSKVEEQRVDCLNELDNLIKYYYKEHNNKNQLKDKITAEFKKLFKEISKEYPVDKDNILTGRTKEDIKAKEIAKIISNLKLIHFSDKIFLYKLFFRDVLDDGGFDVIIGNPPYLTVKGIDKKSSEIYKKIFDSATGSYDLYVLFTEKALELLSKNGIVNYIMPHKWINASFGKGLRGLAKDKISKFISFGAYQVFNASTYTSLVWLQNNKINKHLEYVELDRGLTTNQELEKYLTTLKDDSYTKIYNKDLTKDSWVFTNKRTYKILEKLKEQPLRISDIFEKIFQGLATSKDSVYFLKNCKCKDNLVTAFSDELQKEITIEKELLKPLLKGNDVHRYEKITTDKMVIFPYYIIVEDDKEQAELYTEDELKKDFPNGYKYLKDCETILRGREKGRFNIDGEWFQYGRKQGILNAHKEKLIQPDISLGGNFAYDKQGEYYQTTTLYGYRKYDKIKESYIFYMAILNSKLLWWYLTQTGTTLANGYFRFKPNYLNPFPIPKIDNIEDTKPFEILVDEIMSLKEQGKDTQDLEDEIDGMVYELYGLEPDEVAVIESSI